MTNRWLEALKEEDVHGVLVNDVGVNEVVDTPRGSGQRPAKKPETPTQVASKTSNTPTAVETMRLVARWSMHLGYVAIHDQVDGSWHDVQLKDTPGWALGEARRRKKLYRGGNRNAYRLTAHEMEELWRADHPVTEEGIIEDHPVEEKNQGE